MTPRAEDPEHDADGAPGAPGASGDDAAQPSAAEDGTPGARETPEEAATSDGGPGSDGPVDVGTLDDAEIDRRFASILDQLGVGGGGSATDPYTDSARGRTPLPRLPRAPVESAPPESAREEDRTPRLHEVRPLGPRDQVLEEDLDDPAWGVDGFVEPDPPGPDLSDPGMLLGWLAAVGPVVVGIVLGLLGHRLTVPWMLLGLAVTIGGVVLLVRRLPGERRDPSDGAVV